MTSEQFLGAVRALLACLSGWLISSGTADAATTQLITGSLLVLATAGWSFHANSGDVGQQIAGLVRALIATAGGFAVQRGYIDQATASQLGGAIATLAVAGWSVHAKRPGRKQ